MCRWRWKTLMNSFVVWQRIWIRIPKIAFLSWLNLLFHVYLCICIFISNLLEKFFFSFKNQFSICFCFWQCLCREKRGQVTYKFSFRIKDRYIRRDRLIRLLYTVFLMKMLFICNHTKNRYISTPVLQRFILPITFCDYNIFYREFFWSLAHC